MKILTIASLVEQLQIIANEPQEHMVCLTISAADRIIKRHIVYKGRLGKVDCHPQQIYHRAAIDNALMIVLAHNHPGGLVKPSEQDIKTTNMFVAGARFTGIPLYDHIIVSGKKHYSFREHDLIGPISSVELRGEMM